MRISDSMKYRLLQSNVNKVSEQLNAVQTKIATQKNINTPSDDPAKFATSIQYQTELDNAEQYSTNLQRLSTLVSMYDTSFDSISSQLSSIFDAANSYASMDDNLREAASQQIEGTIEQFVTIANTKLGSTYIFGGKQADSAPFQLNNDYSVTYTVSQTGEDATNIYVDSGQKSQFGVSGRGAFYAASKIAFGSVSNSYGGDIYSNTDTFAYVIGSTNNTISTNETPPRTLTLTSGVYTGASLAKEMQDKLGTDYSVAFDSTTRKFQITNKTDSDVTLGWSAGLASLLGFDGTSEIAESGKLLESDVDTGRESFLIAITSGGSATGNLASRAQYSYSVDGGATYTAVGSVNTGGADGVGDITITTGTNDTFYVNGTAVTISNGTYTGSDLAAEIQTQLNTTVGSGHVVAYDTLTRKFTITNNTGATETYEWSEPASNAAGVLGFSAVESVVSSGSKDTGDYDAGMFIDGSGVVNNANHGMKLAFSVGSVGDIAITTGSNDTFYVSGTAVTIPNGSYTGSDLATAVQTQLNTTVGSGHVVTYDSLTRKFTITNNTGATETYEWSDTNSNAAGVLGFSAVDSVVSSGTGDVSDNSLATEQLSTSDVLQVKDLSIFELLKNLKDAFDSGNSNWVSKNSQYIQKARDLTTKNNAVIAFQGTNANTLIESNKTKTNKFESLRSDLLRADTAELATQFNVLLNTYQALLSTLARIQTVSILDYLK
jgi:flagellin-like hook-associated protein FlgL